MCDSLCIWPGEGLLSRDSFLGVQWSPPWRFPMGSAADAAFPKESCGSLCGDLSPGEPDYSSAPSIPALEASGL